MNVESHLFGHSRDEGCPSRQDGDDWKTAGAATVRRLLLSDRTVSVTPSGTRRALSSIRPGTVRLIRGRMPGLNAVCAQEEPVKHAVTVGGGIAAHLLPPGSASRQGRSAQSNFWHAVEPGLSATDRPRFPRRRVRTARAGRDIGL